MALKDLGLVGVWRLGAFSLESVSLIRQWQSPLNGVLAGIAYR